MRNQCYKLRARDVLRDVEGLNSRNGRCRTCIYNRASLSANGPLPDPQSTPAPPRHVHSRGPASPLELPACGRTHGDEPHPRTYPACRSPAARLASILSRGSAQPEHPPCSQPCSQGRVSKPDPLVTAGAGALALAVAETSEARRHQLQLTRTGPVQSLCPDVYGSARGAWIPLRSARWGRSLA